MERDGYVVRESVFSRHEVAEMIRASEQLVAGLVEGHKGRRFTVGSYTFDLDVLDEVMLKWEDDLDVLHGIEPFAHLSAELEAWGLDPRFTEPMASFVGDDNPVLFTEKLNLKRPFHGGPNPLHQDYPYWIDGHAHAARIATAILYLDDTTRDNGCLEVVPGGHLQGEHPRRTDSDAFGQLEMDPEAKRPHGAGGGRGSRRVGDAVRCLPGPRHRPEHHRHRPACRAVQLPARRVPALPRGAPAPHGQGERVDLSRR